MGIAKIKEYKLNGGPGQLSVHTLAGKRNGWFLSQRSRLALLTGNKINLFLALVILYSTFVSYRMVFNYSINPDIKQRILIEQQILSGEARPPYQYRVMKPAAGYLVQVILSPVINDPVKRHLIAYEFIIFIAFAGIFTLCGLYLKQQFSSLSAVIGILLLNEAIPLSLSGQWQEGDFYNLLFYAAGIFMFVNKKDKFLPLIFFLGAFNREQIIFLNVFYAAYLYAGHRLWTKRSISVLVLNTFMFGLVFIGLRMYFGFKPTEYTVAFNTSNNVASIGVISRLWIEMFLVFVVLCISAYRKCGMYYRLSFLSLGIYSVIFFHMGFMWELAKFLPAYLIMIPMCLQFLNLEHRYKSLTLTNGLKNINFRN